jgi:hypothetical protein
MTLLDGIDMSADGPDQSFYRNSSLRWELVTAVSKGARGLLSSAKRVERKAYPLGTASIGL